MRPLYLLLTIAASASAQDFDGREVAAALARKNVRPAPRLADGHPGLGNSKGSWIPPGGGDRAGTGGGFAGTATPEQKIDVPFSPLGQSRVRCQERELHQKRSRRVLPAAGDSAYIGHWEADSLVGDVTGLNDRSWLDAAGHPHTEPLHVVERFTRVNELIMHYQATIDDPGAYSKSWTAGWNIGFNPRMDVKHLVGK